MQLLNFVRHLFMGQYWLICIIALAAGADELCNMETFEPRWSSCLPYVLRSVLPIGNIWATISHRHHIVFNCVQLQVSCVRWRHLSHANWTQRCDVCSVQVGWRNSASWRHLSRSAGRTKWSWSRRRSTGVIGSASASRLRKLRCVQKNASLDAPLMSRVYWMPSAPAENDAKFVFPTPTSSEPNRVFATLKCSLKSATLASRVCIAT